MFKFYQMKIIFMRAFLGISIPEDLKQKIMQIQDNFSDFDIKFVETENLHFNLRFFEEIEDDRIEGLKKSLEEVCKSFEPFEINITGLGFFPNKNYIRVIWIGVKEGHEQFVAFASTIDNALNNFGFLREENFVPHLTLGRVRSGRNKNELLLAIRKLENLEIGKMKINEIKLFQSILTRNGPVYKEVFTIKL